MGHTDAAEASITAHATHAAHSTHSTHAFHPGHATTTHASHTSHTSRVVFGRCVLFILINPLEISSQLHISHSCTGITTHLIKVSLQEMDFFALLQQPWPVLLLHFLLPKHEFYISRCVIRL